LANLEDIPALFKDDIIYQGFKRIMIIKFPQIGGLKQQTFIRLRLDDKLEQNA
jgi:hypothetical protein